MLETLKKLVNDFGFMQGFTRGNRKMLPHYKIIYFIRTIV